MSLTQFAFCNSRLHLQQTRIPTRDRLKESSVWRIGALFFTQATVNETRDSFRLFSKFFTNIMKRKTLLIGNPVTLVIICALAFNAVIPVATLLLLQWQMSHCVLEMHHTGTYAEGVWTGGWQSLDRIAQHLFTAGWKWRGVGNITLEKTHQFENSRLPQMIIADAPSSSYRLHLKSFTTLLSYKSSYFYYYETIFSIFLVSSSSSWPFLRFDKKLSLIGWQQFSY